jgi:hypothetical protein
VVSGALSLGSSVYDIGSFSGATSGFTPDITQVSYTFTNGGTNPAGSGGQSSTEGPLGAGSYKFDASFAGDANYNAAVSGDEPLTINKGTVTLNTTIHNAADGSVVTGTVHVNTSVYDTASFSGATTGFTPDITAVSYTFTSSGGTVGAGSGAQSSTEGPLMIGSYSFQASFAGDANYNVATSAVEPLTVVGLQQNGLTLGYYSNKNGERDLTGSTTGKTLLSSIYNPLFGSGGALVNPNNTSLSVLVDGNGNYLSNSSMASYSNVKNFLLGAKGKNIANMTSAQLLTTEFNVVLGRVDPTVQVYIPAVGLSSDQTNALASHGIGSLATVQSLLNAAIAELIIAPKPGNGSPDGIYEGALETIFDAINNNKPIFM